MLRLAVIPFLLASAAYSDIVISDPFRAPCSSQSNPACDVIGDPATFDIQKISLEFNSGGEVEIGLNYKGTFPQPAGTLLSSGVLAPFTEYGVTLGVGDLFFGPSGGYKIGIPLVSHDGFQAGSIYAIGASTTLLTAQQALGNPAGVIYRKDRIVRLGGTPSSPLGTGTVSVYANGNGSTAPDLRVELDFDGAGANAILGAADNGNLGVHFGYTCGNDVIDGLAPVPEPSSWLLLGTAAAAGMFMARRKLRAFQSPAVTANTRARDAVR